MWGKKPTSFGASIRPSVRMYQRGFQWTDFRDISYGIFMKIYRENPDFFRTGCKYWTLYMEI
jgi:hypothetical protein